jgi:hypothetical protein
MVQRVKDIWNWVFDRYDSWRLTRKFKKQHSKYRERDPFTYK